MIARGWRPVIICYFISLIVRVLLGCTRGGRWSRAGVLSMGVALDVFCASEEGNALGCAL